MKLTIKERYNDIIKRQELLRRDLEALQKECTHPTEMLKVIDHWYDTEYWEAPDGYTKYDCDCCGKQWHEKLPREVR